MPVLFALLLLFPSAPDQSDPPDREISDWIGRIERGEQLSEALWAISQYYRESEIYREKLFRQARSLGAGWLGLLDRDSFNPHSLYRLALHFQNEHLLLYLQLFHLPEDREKRMEYFDEFYSRSQVTSLKELIRKVAKAEPIRAEELPRTWDFSHFLLIYYLENRYPDSEEFYSDVVPLLLEMTDQAVESRPVQRDYLFASLFQALYMSDRFQEIIPFYEMLTNLKHLPSVRLKRNIYQALDFTLYRSGLVERSLEIQRLHTIPLSRLLGDREGLSAILATHGGYLFLLGRYPEAKATFQTALSDSSHLTPYNRTLLLNNLSLVYYKLGEMHRYVETQMQALDHAVERSDYGHQLRIYRNLHIYFRETGNRELALQYMERAVELAEESGTENDLASLLISRAVFHDRYLSQPDQALSYLQEAEELLESTTDYRLQVRILSERAELLRSRGALDRSREIYRQVYSIGALNNNSPMLLEALVNMASVELEIGGIQKAEEYLDEFSDHPEASNADFPLLVDAHRIRAEIAFRRGRMDQAEELLSLTFHQVLERTENTTDVEAGYWHVEGEYLRLFELYARLLAAQDRLTDLVGLLDQLKTINDASLFDNPLIQAGRMSDEELAESRSIRHELDQQRKRLLTASAGERIDIQNQISMLTARKNLLTRSSFSLSHYRPLNIRTIQAHLAPHEMILHTTRIMDHFYLIMIDSRSQRMMVRPLGGHQEGMFKRAIRGLSSGRTNLDHLYEVYSWLGLGEIPERITSLTVIPDSYLFQLPLDVLPVSPPPSPQSYGAATYLIEKMELRYLNSLQDLLSREPVRSYRYDFAGIGISSFPSDESEPLVPLPSAPREIRNIIHELSRTGSKKAHLEEEGTPEAFSRSASDSRILHLASHSRISGNDPLFSTLYLAPGENENPEDPGAGRIYAWQLFEMDMTNELVMLNSCDSGSGEYFMGSGIMGISRALRYAGARSLVLNSWAVNDQFASDFAVRFYRGLNRGYTKSRSLRQAKIDFLKNKNANPHYWGSYMLNGSNDPVVEKRGEKGIHAALVALFMILLVISRYRLRGGHHPICPQGR